MRPIKTLALPMIALTALALSACAKPEVRSFQLDTKQKAAFARASRERWPRMVARALEELAPELLSSQPADADEFCAGFPNDQEKRIVFWTGLILAMAKEESSLRPEATHAEDFKNHAGQPLISRGLMQISFESAKDGGCTIGAPEDLHDPETNLRCAVHLLNTEVARAGAIAGRDAASGAWHGGARLWAVLRFQKHLGPIKARLMRIPFCRAN